MKRSSFLSSPTLALAALVALATVVQPSPLRADWLVTNSGSNSIERFDSAGNWLGVFSTEVENPLGITQGLDGYIYVSTYQWSSLDAPRIQKLDATTGLVVDTFFLQRPDNSLVNSFWDITTDSATGDIYVAGSEAGLWRFNPLTNPSGELLSDYNALGLHAQAGSLYFGRDAVYQVSTDNTSIANLVISPDAINGLTGNTHDILLDLDGNIYVADPNSGLMKKFTSGGTFVGDFVDVGYTNGTNPTGMAFGADGRFYVVGHDDDRIYVRNTLGDLETFIDPTHLSGPQFMAEISAVPEPSGAVLLLSTGVLVAACCRRRTSLCSGQGLNLSRTHAPPSSR
ncbi:MAG: hypothetical protein ACOYMN_11625 [Roseimicrobium sp.]